MVKDGAIEPEIPQGIQSTFDDCGCACRGRCFIRRWNNRIRGGAIDRGKKVKSQKGKNRVKRLKIRNKGANVKPLC